MKEVRVRRRLPLFCTFLGILLIASACAGNGEGNKAAPKPETAAPAEQKKVEITFAWWGTAVHNERYQKIIDAFVQKNPHIEINVQYADFNGFWEKLAVQAAGNILPELIQMDFNKINEWVTRDLLQPLDEHIDQGVINLKDVNPVMLEGGRINNRMYALNVGTNSPVLIYDPDMFRQAGVQPLEPGYTWEQFADTSRRLKEKLGKDYYVTPSLEGIMGFYHYLREQGYWFYNQENNGLGFEDKPLVDFFNYWIPLRAEGVTPPANILLSVKKNEDKLIIKNKSPLDSMYDAQTQAFQELSGKSLDLTMLPSRPGGQKALYYKPSVMLSVTKNASPEQAKAAAMFMEFFTASEEANLILLGIRGTPIHKHIQDLLYSKVDEKVKKIFDYSKMIEPYVGPLYPAEPAGHSEVVALWERLYEQLVFDKIKPEEFARQLREGVGKIFNK